MMQPAHRRVRNFVRSSNPIETGSVIIFARPSHGQAASCLRCGTRSSRSSELNRLLRSLLMRNKTASNALWRSTRSNRRRLSGSPGTNLPAYTLRRQAHAGNGGCSLRVVWRLYRWLYPHSAWASRVHPSDAARQDEHDIIPAIARRFPNPFRVTDNTFEPPEKRGASSTDGNR